MNEKKNKEKQGEKKSDVKFFFFLFSLFCAEKKD